MTAKTKHNDQTLNLRIPNALHEQLKIVAEAQYMPVSVMVRLALSEYVRTHATSALARVAVNTQHPQIPQRNPNLPKAPSMQLPEWADPNDDWL